MNSGDMMQQLDMFTLVGYNPSKYSLSNLDCKGDKSKLAKKNKAIKKGFEVGFTVIMDDCYEYEITSFFFDSDGYLLCGMSSRSCHMSWNVFSSRLKIKK